MPITLTKEQFKQKYGDEGLGRFYTGVTERRQKQEDPGFFKRAGRALGERFEDIKKTFKETATGEITPIESSVRVVGGVAGGLGDVIGAVVEPQVKEVVQGIAQTELGGQALQKLSEGLDSYEAWKAENKKNERIGKSLESVVNISDLFGAAAAGKAVTRGAIGAGRRVGRRVADTAVEGVERVRQPIRDVVPTQEQVVSDQVVKALDLTQGDISNIRQNTGNEVGQWMAANNLIRDNKRVTKKAIDDFFQLRHSEVRDRVRSVGRSYAPADVPSFKDSLLVVKDAIKDVKGLELDNSVVDALLKKKKITLEDVQETKEIIDDHFKLFKVTGEEMAGVRKKGIVNLRRDLRAFIEDEIDEALNVDIRALNNDVATAKSLSNAIDARDTRGLTRQNITAGDFGAFGAGSIFATPLTGFALVLGKKIIESPSFRLRFANWLDSVNDAKKLKIKKQIRDGVLPSGLPKDLRKEVRRAAESAGAAGGVATVEGAEEAILD